MKQGSKNRKSANKAKTIFFDVGGVLLEDFIEKKLIDLADKYGKNLGELLKLKGKYRPLADAGKISDSGFWRYILKETGVEAESEDYNLDAYMKPVAGGFELAKKLKDGGYKIAILSNDSREMSKCRRELFSLDELFCSIIISSEHGVIKPDEEIYKIALNRMKVDPQNAVFIDDKIENVLAARKLGIAAVHFQNANQAEMELRKMGINLE